MFWDTDAIEECARGAGCGIKARAQAVDDDNGHQLHDLAPLLPAMETPQVVRAHDPDESDPRAAGQQPRYRIVSVSRLNDSFEACDIDARVMGERAYGGDSLWQGCKAAGVLQGIAGSDQPPYAVELEPLEREQGGRKMRLVRRVESSAEQADPHAGRMRGQEPLGNGGLGSHGRV